MINCFPRYVAFVIVLHTVKKLALTHIDIEHILNTSDYAIFRFVITNFSSTPYERQNNYLLLSLYFSLCASWLCIKFSLHFNLCASIECKTYFTLKIYTYVFISTITMHRSRPLNSKKCDYSIFRFFRKECKEISLIKSTWVCISQSL